MNPVKITQPSPSDSWPHHPSFQRGIRFLWKFPQNRHEHRGHHIAVGYGKVPLGFKL